MQKQHKLLFSSLTPACTYVSRVLIHGGDSVVCACVVQLARAMHASHIAVTCAQSNIDTVRRLGADRTIDPGTHHFSAVLQEDDRSRVDRCPGVGLEIYSYTIYCYCGIISLLYMVSR